jgi:hypothetical protein
MAKSSKSKIKSERSWFQKLDPDLIREAFDQATVDAYGDDEQHTALLTAIEDQLEFPFEAQVLGKAGRVVGMEWPHGDAFGLDLVVEFDGRRHRIGAQSVELSRPRPPGHLFLAAYLDWRRRF